MAMAHSNCPERGSLHEIVDGGWGHKDAPEMPVPPSPLYLFVSWLGYARHFDICQRSRRIRTIFKQVIWL